jgi:hypothetical protein
MHRSLSPLTLVFVMFVVFAMFVLLDLSFVLQDVSGKGSRRGAQE